MTNLQLPPNPVPDRFSVVRPLAAFSKDTYAELEGPGCIQHIWATMTSQELVNRKAVIRIYFDDQSVPNVEAPVGDFFGVMHGKAWYPIDTRYLSVKAQSGYNCYFPMPFAKSARIEFETADQPLPFYLMVDWHRYPDHQLAEPKRFCARWRREFPTERYGEDFLMLDADGPGQLAGFVYGVRLIDDEDRWSHGGSDNIYIDGEGEQPVFMRGIGGEDTFGTSYGGALHPPETHLYAGMPYYVHEDTGEARPAQRVVGYRFFEHDTIAFQKSIHLRFGCMRNDICATTYWYSEAPVRPFFELPPWELLTCLHRSYRDPVSLEMPRGSHDRPLPESGEWWLCGPFSNHDSQAMTQALPAEGTFEPDAVLDGMHEEGSPFLTEGSRSAGRDRARWLKRAAIHGFIDLNRVFRPHTRGVSPTHTTAAIARCTLNAPGDTTAKIQLAWDDHSILRVNGDQVYDLGEHRAFRKHEIDVPLRAGDNTVVLKLSNTKGSNHGGWAFAFRAATADGKPLQPLAEA